MSIGECQELKRFLALQSELAAACYAGLERYKEESSKTTLRLVDMEAAYLTVEFFRKLPHDGEIRSVSTGKKGGNAPPEPQAVDRYGEGHYRTIASNVQAYIAMVSDTLKDTIPKAVVHCQVREAKRSLFNNFYNRIADRATNDLGEMLDEDPSLMARRQESAKRLELYQKARDEINAAFT